MTQQSFPLPEGAVILGAIWRALDLQFPAKAQGLRKFLRGQRHLSDQESALRNIARVFVTSGYVVVPGSEHDRVVGLVANGLANMIARWDQLVGHARMLAPRADAVTTATRYVRLAAIDIAVRAAALDLLLRTPPPPSRFDEADEAPAWAVAGQSHKKFLEAFTQVIRSRRLPKKLTSDLGDVKPKATEEWFYRAKWPSLKSIENVAKGIFETASTAASSWRSYLAWHRGLSIICNDLTALIDRDAVIEIATGFRRIRLHAFGLLGLAAVNGQPMDELLARLVIEGAPYANAIDLIDGLIDFERNAMLVGNGDRSSWMFDLRAASAHWILNEIAIVSREPLEPVGISVATQERILATFTIRFDQPEKLIEACAGDPAAELWLIRSALQGAFIRGDFVSVVPIVSRIADVLNTDATNFEAGLVIAFSGNADLAIQYLERIGDSSFHVDVKAFIVALKALGGRHAEALDDLTSIAARDSALDYAEAIALRGVGRAEDALAIFEQLLEASPGQAPLLDEAARCCYTLASEARGNTAARWTTKGNKYAKDATRLGRPDPRMDATDKRSRG